MASNSRRMRIASAVVSRSLGPKDDRTYIVEIKTAAGEATHGGKRAGQRLGVHRAAARRRSWGCDGRPAAATWWAAGRPCDLMRTAALRTQAALKSDHGFYGLCRHPIISSRLLLSATLMIGHHFSISGTASRGHHEPCARTSPVLAAGTASVAQVNPPARDCVQSASNRG